MLIVTNYKETDNRGPRKQAASLSVTAVYK